jgi:hypothetical protein
LAAKREIWLGRALPGRKSSDHIEDMDIRAHFAFLTFSRIRVNPSCSMRPILQFSANA